MVLKSWYITWEGVQRKMDWKTYRKKIKKYDTKGRIPDSWLYYSGYAEDDFYILYLQLFFQTIHDRYFLSKIRLVLSPTLYKFIVWLAGLEPNPVLGFKPKLILTIGAVCGRSLIWFKGNSGLALEMEESGSHQPTISPYQDNVNPHQAESGGSQHNNSVVNPQRRGDHEGSAHITHTSKSQSRGKSHVSHAKNERDM